MISKIIHQIYLGDFNSEADEYQKRWELKWKEIYPDFEYIKWNYDLVNSELKEEIKEIQHIISSKNIYNTIKGDVLRFLVLKKYGGLYADCDVEPIRRLDDSFFNYNFFSGYNMWNMIEIAFMASEPNKGVCSDYYVTLLKMFETYFKNNNIDTNNIDNSKINTTHMVHSLTFPTWFTEWYKNYVMSNNLNDNYSMIFSEIYFCGQDLNNKDYMDIDYFHVNSKIYNIHHWYGCKSWTKQ